MILVDTSVLIHFFKGVNSEGCKKFTLLRRKPRVFRPWMNAGRVPFEAPKERSRVCFGGFRPTKLVEESRGLARGAPLLRTSISLIFSPAPI
jgi:hypothetical protein